MSAPMKQNMDGEGGSHGWFDTELGDLIRFVWILVLGILTTSYLPHSTPATPWKETRRVLIINDLSTLTSPGFDAINHAILSRLEKSPHQVELYTENLETTLFPGEDAQRQIRAWLMDKYSDREPNLIIAVGAGALTFMVESHDAAFPKVPVVFCGSTELDQLRLDSYFTGVWATAEPDKTLDVALHLQPRTSHVVVVGGAGVFDRTMEALVRKAFLKYDSRLEFEYLTDLDMPALLGRLQRLPKNTIVYHTSISEDAQGAHFIDATQSVPLIASASSAPVFVMDDVDIGRGAVGGKAISWEADGLMAGGMAVRVLNGENPQDIPIVRANPAYIFDWRALKRWGYRESDLPSGSRILFREPSLWERTKWLWVGGLVIILSLSTLSAYLEFSRRQLKLARNAQLNLSGLLIDAQEKERSRLASELHDDFSQRLALLALGLENAREALPESSEAAKRQLDDLLVSASELGADLHTVSHRLHSSTLKSLGLAPGVSALCREFAVRQGIQVDFSSENIPPNVPPDVALCLFRIVQEGLQNLKKHSCVSRAEVTLHGTADGLFASVSDQGKGFDTKDVNKMGLGIRSMQERVRLLEGQFEILSEPGNGTTIKVSVPLRPTTERVKI
jgi:signal transduction histidine kinase